MYLENFWDPLNMVDEMGYSGEPHILLSASNRHHPKVALDNRCAYVHSASRRQSQADAGLCCTIWQRIKFIGQPGQEGGWLIMIPPPQREASLPRFSQVIASGSSAASTGHDTGS